MIHLTDKIRDGIYKGNYACRIFIELQKSIDTVDRHILLKKLAYYGVKRISNQLFASHIINRKKFVSVNGCNSNLPNAKCGVPQGSITGSFLFLISINISHVAKHSTTFQMTLTF